MEMEEQTPSWGGSSFLLTPPTIFLMALGPAEPQGQPERSSVPSAPRGWLSRSPSLPALTGISRRDPLQATCWAG